MEVLAFDSARYVGARIGIHDPSGRKVGAVSHLRNTEYVLVAGHRARVRSMVAAVVDAGLGPPVDGPVPWPPTRRGRRCRFDLGVGPLPTWSRDRSGGHSGVGAPPRSGDDGGVTDMGALDGRVAIITGAGRGIGREHALLFAAEGAKVVVNDLGGAVDGSGDDRSPAQQVVDEITAAGGEAVANADDVTDWEGGKRLIDTAVETFGDLARPGQQRRHPARPGAGQHVRGRLGLGRPRPPEGPLRPHPACRRLLA